MKNMNLSAFRVYIVPILVLLTIVLLVPLVLMPQLDRIKEKNLEVKKGNERLVALNKKIEALNGIDETDESLKLLEMEKVVPGGKELAQLVVGMRNLAALSKLKVTEMTFEPGKVATGSATATASATKKEKAAIAREKKTKEEEQKDKVIFSMSLGGKLSRVKGFLAKIEKAKRLLGVRKIEITEDEKIYKIDFEILVPFTEREKKGDVVASPLPILTALHESAYEFVSKFNNFTNMSIPLVPKGIKNPFK